MIKGLLLDIFVILYESSLFSVLSDVLHYISYIYLRSVILSQIHLKVFPNFGRKNWTVFLLFPTLCIGIFSIYLAVVVTSSSSKSRLLQKRKSPGFKMNEAIFFLFVPSKIFHSLARNLNSQKRSRIDYDLRMVSSWYLVGISSLYVWKKKKRNQVAWSSFVA